MARNLEAPQDRNLRNVFLYNNDGNIIGGTYQNGSLTNNNFIFCCSIFLVIHPTPPATQPSNWALYRLNDDGSTGSQMPRNSNPLPSPANFVVLASNGKPVAVDISNEPSQRRVSSAGRRTSQLSQRSRTFTERIRARDQYCMLTGIPNSLAAAGYFYSFEAAHIYPDAREPTWVREGYSRWITDASPSSEQGVSKIHSAQNGLLLSRSAHSLFQIYAVCVNPDDHHKIVSFLPDDFQVDGRTLEPPCRTPNHPFRVSDDALRWHFRQGVLIHMRGVGEKLWDFDLGPGDDIEAIMTGPDPAERMELELYTRLGGGHIEAHDHEPEAHSRQSISSASC